LCTGLPKEGGGRVLKGNGQLVQNVLKLTLGACKWHVDHGTQHTTQEDEQTGPIFLLNTSTWETTCLVHRCGGAAKKTTAQCTDAMVRRKKIRGRGARGVPNK